MVSLLKPRPVRVADRRHLARMLLGACVVAVAPAAPAMTVAAADLGHSAGRLQWLAEGAASGPKGELDKALHGGMSTGDPGLDLLLDAQRGRPMRVEDSLAAFERSTRGSSPAGRLSMPAAGLPNRADAALNAARPDRSVLPQFNLPPGQVFAPGAVGTAAGQRAWSDADGASRHAGRPGAESDGHASAPASTVRELVDPIRQFAIDHFVDMLGVLALAGLVRLGLKAYSRRI